MNHHEGAFRVGGTKEYLHVIPVDENGNDITSSTPVTVQPASYRIEFRIGNFKVASTSSNFLNGLAIYDESYFSERLYLTDKGVYRQSLNGAESEDDWDDAPTGSIQSSLLAVSINGNTIYSNDVASSLPGTAWLLTKTQSAYNLQDGAKDLYGYDTEGLTLDTSKIGSSDNNCPVIKSDGTRAANAYNGDIKIDSQKNLLFWNKGGIKRYTDEMDAVFLEAQQSWADSISTAWGLTAAQVEALTLENTEDL